MTFKSKSLENGKLGYFKWWLSSFTLYTCILSHGHITSGSEITPLCNKTDKTIVFNVVLVLLIYSNVVRRLRNDVHKRVAECKANS